MSNSPTQYLVGIDLGTTHTVVAYTEADKLNAKPAIKKKTTADKDTALSTEIQAEQKLESMQIDTSAY